MGDRTIDLEDRGVVEIGISRIEISHGESKVVVGIDIGTCIGPPVRYWKIEHTSSSDLGHGIVVDLQGGE